MKANKRIRDLKRRSAFRLFVLFGRVKVGVTTYPVTRGEKANDVRLEVREREPEQDE